MNCFMFPGQPLTVATPLPDDRDFADIAAMVEKKNSLDLYSLSREGEGRTENVMLQVYGTAMSLYRHRRLLGESVHPDVIAEHSMGIYAALAASGSISEGDALELVHRIGLCMACMGGANKYALGCVVGMTADPLTAIAANNGVFMANLNTSRHFLLSGPFAAMEGAMAESLAGGAFSANSFPCDAPLHSPLMEELTAPLAEICNGFRYREPSVPVIDHIEQKRIGAKDMAGFLVRELMEPVYWERTYLFLRSSGIGRFVEAGVGDSLKKYNRWIDNEYR
jgi:[acyl-carrier-protein] S-malonyltransferase